ncbi:MAG: acetate--CoA ligase family protein [Haloarculaceae archaeon]
MQTLFSPSSIAVVGASADPERVSGLPVKYLQDHGYRGEIYPVNPNHERVAGLKCYPDVDALPEAPDLVLVIVPGGLVVDVVEASLERDVENVLIVSSGFSETGTEEGERAERRIADLAAEHDATVVGPNSQGVIEFHDRVAASFTPALRRESLLAGEVSFVTQSGAFGGALTTMLQDEGVGLSKWIATGNEADTGALDVLSFLAGDERTGVVAGYIEGFDDGRELIELKRTDAGIDLPVVLLKVGRSERGRSAAASHTGTVASAHEVYEAVFRETGVMAVDDVDLFVDLTRSVSLLGTLPGDRLGVVTTSGGAGVHIADVAEEEGLFLPTLEGGTSDRIREYIPEFGSALNPVDLTGQVVNSKEAFSACLRALFEDDGIATIVLQITNASGESAEEYAERVVEVAGGYEKPLFLCWTGGVEKESAMERYRDAGIPVFENPARCVRAVAAMTRFAESKPLLRAATDLPARTPEFGTAAGDAPSVLAETDAKALLAEYGVDVPEAVLVTDPAELGAAAEVVGFPAVAKLVAPDLPHRDRVGGVRTGIEDRAALETACRELFDLARDLDVDLTGVSVQEQVDGEGELALGIHVDPDFGPVCMLGRGGVDIEETRDVTFRTIPVARGQAASMLGEFGSAVSLDPAQRESVVDAVVSLSELYLENPWIREADVNPLLLTPGGATAVDALFVGPDGSG